MEGRNMKKMTFRFALALLIIWILPQSVLAAQMLVPGGQVIGLELGNDTVTIAGFDEAPGSAAKAAGLKIGDEILSIDGQSITGAGDIRKALNLADGTVDVQILREGQTHTVRLSPQITAAGPRLGIYLRKGITGIGTVTFYDPDTGRFGTLGHGVNGKNSTLLEMTQGSAYPASILSVKKGESGEPGQLLGTLAQAEPIGTLTKNTAQGVFGTSPIGWPGKAMEAATADAVRTGNATILSTVADQKVQEYSVEILKIYPADRTNGRNLLLKVTDPALLEATGGIVQGMSGSPIIQDGKLIGAVTHVLVNDPTTGYGIFIENMLDAAA